MPDAGLQVGHGKHQVVDRAPCVRHGDDRRARRVGDRSS
jgi:hypothetical protein